MQPSRATAVRWLGAHRAPEAARRRNRSAIASTAFRVPYLQLPGSGPVSRAGAQSRPSGCGQAGTGPGGDEGRALAALPAPNSVRVGRVIAATPSLSISGGVGGSRGPRVHRGSRCPRALAYSLRGRPFPARPGRGRRTSALPFRQPPTHLICRASASDTQVFSLGHA